MKNHQKKRPTRAQKIAAAREVAKASKLKTFVGVDFAKLEANPAVRAAKVPAEERRMVIGDLE